MSEIVSADPDLMHETPCFRGTRVPVRLLLDDLKSHYTVEEFLAGCPTVTREQVERYLNSCKTWLPNPPSPDRRVHQSSACTPSSYNTSR